MPVRTAYAGAGVVGEVLTAANLNRIPGGWIGFNQITAPVSLAANTSAGVAGLNVAVTVGASRRLRITAHASLTASAAGTVFLDIVEGATTLSRALVPLAAGEERTTDPSAVITPTQGAHTYQVNLFCGAAAPTVNATGSNPAFILVEDIGPA